MGYLKHRTALAQTPAAIQAQRGLQLNAWEDAAVRTRRHWLSDSDSWRRPLDCPVPSGRCSLQGGNLSLFVALLFFAASGVAQAATMNAASPSFLDVTTAVASAVDGDTVIIPAGTASWTTTLIVTKGITLIGQTTVDPVAKTANDQTIILDDETVDWAGAISISPAVGKTVRVSGITFKKGTRTTTWNGGAVNIGGTQGVAARLDHCHFIASHHVQCVYVGGPVYGVIDHNLFDFPVGSPYGQSILVRMSYWNGNTNGTGDGSYADYPWFGTAKFLFIEDNCFNNTSGTALMGTTDADFAARMVFRYNHFYDVQVGNHGTEGRYRGARAGEVYNNDFHFTTSTPLGGVRTGAYLFHDNSFSGVQGVGLSLNYLRYVFRFASVNGFFGASGDSPWDYNATESDGTHVDGHSPYLFASGTCATGSNTTTIVDSGSPGWATNQWTGYTVKRVSDSGISMITGNTANTLTVTFTTGGYGSSPTWTSGDQYQIHKVLIALDQPGRGKSDLITGGYNNPPPTLNSVTATAAWPHQALEPCYSWNNLYNGTVSLGFYVASVPPNTLLVQGRDYYNDSSNAAVVAKYTASLNGVDYTGPYTYPHPLVGGGGPQAPQGLHVIPY